MNSDSPRIIILGANKSVSTDIAKRVSLTTMCRVIVADTSRPDILAAAEPLIELGTTLHCRGHLGGLHPNVIFAKPSIQEEEEAAKVKAEEEERHNRIHRALINNIVLGNHPRPVMSARWENRDRPERNIYSHRQSFHSFPSFSVAVPKSHLYQTLSYTSGKGAATTKHLDSQRRIKDKPIPGKRNSQRLNKKRRRNAALRRKAAHFKMLRSRHRYGS